MKSNLLDKLRKSSTIKSTSVISESELFLGKDVIPTKYPAFNIALSGDIEGGLTPGLTVFAGKSKHFKSNFCLILAEAYLKKYDDAILLFYDCEFGSPISYFESMGINPDRVLHTPIASIEELKHDISVQLSNIERGDKVIIVLDSLGNLASKKETEDALDGKTVTDMTRAKAVKSLFRIITAQLTIKNIPMLVIGHTYDTLEMFSKSVVSGGCLVEDTVIQMSDGSLKPIQSITEGEFVKTLLGNKEVTNVWNPDTLIEGTPECYEVEFEDGFKVICSDVHKFLDMNGEWIEAKDLSVGNDIVVSAM